jgi:MFS family permease
MSDPYRALRIRDFRLVFIAGTLSVVGAFLESVALSWELYERTGDPLVLGTIGLIEFLPVLLFALPAGHLADRFDRRTIAVTTRLLEGCAAAGLAYLSWTQGSVPLIYAVLFVTSMARTFQGPASGALLPLIVPQAVFSNAVAWQTTAMQLAGMIAPALVGALIAVLAPVKIAGGPLNVGATIAYAISAVLSLVIAFCLWNLRVRETEKRREAATLADVFAGVRFVFQQRLILAAITLDLFAVLFGGAVALLPVFAKDVLHVGPQGFGLLRAAPAIGAVGMALLLTRMPPIRQAGRTLLWVVAGFGVATLVFGLSQNFVLSMVALGFTGAFDNVSMVIRGSLVPLLTPNAMRGRVAAVERVFISSSNELGAVESGITARLWGAVPAVIVGGIGTLVVVALVALFAPQLRALGSIEEIRPE